MQLRLRNGLN